MSNIINIINFITRSSLYVIIGLWSSFIVIENNCDTKMKDVDTIVKDIINNYDDLIVKMKNLEERIDKLKANLETEGNISKIKLAEHKDEHKDEHVATIIEEIILKNSNSDFFNKELDIQEEKDNELIQMANEDTNTVISSNTTNMSIAIASKRLDDEIVDLSQDIYPVSNQNNSNQNKKSWIKTLLFM
jgi:cell division septum initiation protein DivIVA